MKKIAFFFLLLLPSIPAFSQRTPDDMVAIFFEDFKKDKGQSIENIYQTSEWMSRARDAIANIKGELEKLTPEYIGKNHGYSLICKKQLADCFVLQSYIVRYDRQPLRFTFEFYKPDKEWQLFSFAFDVNLDDELEEAAKVFYLQLDR